MIQTVVCICLTSLLLVCSALAQVQDGSICPNCGFENPADNRFCNKCGGTLRSTAVLAQGTFLAALVLSQESGDVFKLDIGRRDGVSRRASYEIVTETNREYHPETGELLSVDYDVVGRVIVKRLNEKTCEVDYSTRKESTIPQVGDRLVLRREPQGKTNAARAGDVSLSLVGAPVVSQDESGAFAYPLWTDFNRYDEFRSAGFYGLAVNLGIGRGFSLRPGMVWSIQFHDWYAERDGEEYYSSDTYKRISGPVLTLRYAMPTGSAITFFLEGGSRFASGCTDWLGAGGLRLKASGWLAFNLGATVLHQPDLDFGRVGNHEHTTVHLYISPDIKLFRF